MDFKPITQNEEIDRLLTDKSFVERLQATGDEEELVRVFSELGISVSQSELERLYKHICCEFFWFKTTMDSDAWGDGSDFDSLDFFEVFTNADWFMLFSQLYGDQLDWDRMIACFNAVLESRLNDTADRNAVKGLLYIAGWCKPEENDFYVRIFNHIIIALLAMEDCGASLYCVENIGQLYEKARRFRPFIHKPYVHEIYQGNFELFLSHQASEYGQSFNRPAGFYAGLCYREFVA